MPVANYNKKILDLKRWVVMPTPAPVATAGATLISSSRLHKQRQLYINTTAIAYLYDPEEDGFVQLPTPALSQFAAGACATSGCVGPTGTATGGSTTTINTNLNLQRSLAGYQIEITAGPNAGVRRTILHNTVGSNSVITVDTVYGTAITASSVYRLLTPRWYVVASGAPAAGSFRMYCFALNTWTSLQQTGLPTVSTDSRLIATPSIAGLNENTVFATGTATAGGASTLTNSGKAWATNQWANSQIRITAGTGVGQIRTIASNTATVITTSAAWAVNPDATSVYEITGNDDYLYYMGSAAVTLYRYSISANTWTTLSPGAARAAAPAAGMSGHWVWDVRDAHWNSENAIINGQRIYSFRGGSGGLLDYYDIAANTWVSAVPYAPATETFTTGSKYVYAAGYLYIHKDVTGRWFRYSVSENSLEGWTQNVYPSGAALVGDTAFDVVDSVTGVRFIHMILNTSTIHMRCMVV
jgi:hypothetical protein